MATVTGLTAERMLAIEGASVVDGDVVGDNLILTQHNGTQINAGSVRGPAGPQGAVGQDLVIASALPVLEVGLVGQIRAGRQLTAADFTNMGLSVPLGLWNLSDLTDASGNGRNLLNKGAVPVVSGINGLPSTAAQFNNQVTQGLYIPDAGAADPLRIKTGSFGCWFRTLKGGINQALVARWSKTVAAFQLRVDTTGVIGGFSSDTGVGVFGGGGHTVVTDGRWHFAVITVDGAILSIYVDGVCERTYPAPPMQDSIVAPFNIGAMAADAANDASMSSYARVDEAFITSDVLSEDQIRNLYCAKLPHTLGVTPSRIALNVRRRRKGAAMAVSDFPTSPLRLFNFSGGSLGNEGSDGVPMSNPSVCPVASGVDGSRNNAYSFNSAQTLWAPDTGLPSGLASRSLGAWFKTSKRAAQTVVVWGTTASADMRISMNGVLYCTSGADVIQGPYVDDGNWHHVVLTEENTPVDGIKRKAYLDGKLIGTSTGMTSLVPGGTTGLLIASATNSTTQAYTGVIDSVFITDYAVPVETIQKLYAKGSQVLVPSPKNVGDHVEGLTATDILATFDSLESQHLIDLTVAP